MPEVSGSTEAVHIIRSNRAGSVVPGTTGMGRSDDMAFNRPRKVVVVTEIPKTATGKLKRYLLRDQAAQPPSPAPQGVAS